MTMTSITGLKIDNGRVYITEKDDAKWMQASVAKIEALEALQRMLEDFKYPTKIKKKSDKLQEEQDIGSGTMKSVLDEDGDISYIYKKAAKKIIHLDEDAEFGHSAHGSTSINHWAMNKSAENEQKSSKRTLEKSEQSGMNKRRRSEADSGSLSGMIKGMNIKIVSTTAKKNRTVADISDMKPNDIMDSDGARAGQRPNTNRKHDKIGKFTKRPSSARISQTNELRKKITHIFLDESVDTATLDRNIVNSQNLKNVSFKSKRGQFIKGVSSTGILLGQFRYNIKNDVQGVLECSFYLKKE
ncbi:hypothetical protein ENBRE01_0447 [Enteropsectra breve]|nr:hypothetical protein ENBRE01_0447 [Enteropsectra breve]